MQVTQFSIALLVSLTFSGFGLENLGLSAEQRIRPPYVAGVFYPTDAKELGKMIDGFLAHASAEKLEGSLVALICPHAAYQYSGGVAAYSYIQLKGRSYDRVVVIAPSHYESFPFSSIYDGDAYRTPFGDVPVDHDFAAKLAKLSSTIKISGRGHGEVDGHGEHALELELPFLQRVLGQFKMVPIVMGDSSYDACRALGIALAKAVQGTNTLILVSSDLSHYHPYDEAERMDHEILKTIEEWDYLSLSQNIERNIWNGPCGGGPIVAAMIAAERLGAHRAQILKYANSGDVMGDKSRVVGYGAIALVAEKEKATTVLSDRTATEPTTAGIKEGPPDYATELGTLPPSSFEDVDQPPISHARSPHTYALVVGIEHYRTPIPPVPFALHDAVIVKRYLVSDLGVLADQVRGLSDPSLSQLRVGVQTLINFATTDPSDETLLLIYYAGHGVPDLDTKSPYLLPVDADPAYIRLTGYGLKDISEELSQLHARSVLWLDACFSGAASRPGAAGGGLLHGARPAYVEVPTPASPRVIIFSATAAEQISNALEPAQHGLFTYYLLSGLRGKAADASGQVTVRSLYDYLLREVPAAAVRMNQQQTPTLSPSPEVLGRDADMTLVKLPAR